MLAAVACVVAIVASVLTRDYSFVLHDFYYEGKMAYCKNFVDGELMLDSIGYYHGDTIYCRQQIDGIPVTWIRLSDYRESVTKIGIPEGVESVYLKGFNNLSYLYTPHGVKNVEIEKSGLERIDMEDGVTDISLKGCKSLVSVRIPSGATNIDLSGCSSLRSVKISEGVKRIDASAFDGCVSLSYLAVPSGIEMTGDFRWDRPNRL